MKINLIEVGKDKLLDIIQENKNEHTRKYNEAMKGYRIGVVAGLEELQETAKDFVLEVEKALEVARDGGEMKTDFRINPSEPFYELKKPQTHEYEYETVIGMIELDLSDQVEIDTGEYKNYVQDKWDWKRDWDIAITGSMQYTTGSLYSGSKSTINWNNC